MSSLDPGRESESILEKLPPLAQQWAESLPWHERRFLLSLCHLMCAATPEMQAQFLDDYTANGLVHKLIEDKESYQRVKNHLKQFQINMELDEITIRNYIRQFYIHSAQDVRQQSSIYLESALKLLYSTEERNNVFYYILGFEVLKMFFQLSWSEQEKLYQLQKNQDFFLKTYIKPIQYTHKVNNIIRPDDKKAFFQKRDYFVQKPKIKPTKLIHLVMATFQTNIVTNLGFSVIRHPNSLVFDYDYILTNDQQDFPY